MKFILWSCVSYLDSQSSSTNCGLKFKRSSTTKKWAQIFEEQEKKQWQIKSMLTAPRVDTASETFPMSSLSRAVMASFITTALICKFFKLFIPAVKYIFVNFSNLDCAVCNEKLIPDTDDTQFRPRNFIVEENLKAQLDGINEGITDLKNLIVEQKEEQSKTSRLVE